jgi:hypothetical protein
MSMSIADPWSGFRRDVGGDLFRCDRLAILHLVTPANLDVWGSVWRDSTSKSPT